MIKKENQIFFNQSFDKKRLKALISWVFKKYGEAEALKVLDLLKETGFRNATKAGISIGLHDLTTPVTKSWLISESQQSMNNTEIDFVGAKITATERSQRIIDTWHRASESLSKQVVDYFNVYDRFNPVYIMALSGARGNFSQVRQLIGMRGLMADQQGKIVNFPIRSNLREGLTIIEYFISCSGARKGLVDTALRTADTGYLTRRLVDVSHHVVVKRIRCNTSRGIQFKDLQSYNKILLSLKERLVGRVLAENISVKSTVPHINLTCAQRAKEFVPRAQAYTCNTNLRFVLGATGVRDVLPRSFGVKKGTSQIEDLCRTDQKMHGKDQKMHGKANNLLAKKDTEISPKLSAEITQHRNKVLIRSPLTCGLTHEVCQLCYGWSISQGSLVSLGDAVGVIAAQSIGEPGTQLTMRTFHTGGVFSGDLLQEIRAPHAGQIEFPKAFQGLLIRTGHGRIAFLSKTSGSLILKNYTGSSEVATPKSLASQPEGLLEVPNRSHLSCARTPHTFGVKVCEAKIRQLNSTTIPIKPFTMLFVRQNEKVDVNQLLAEFSIQSKEGNQPIKTQQTIFAELSGRVIEDYSGKTYLKYLKESSFLVDNLQHYLSQLVQSPPKSDLYSPQSLAPTNCRALRFALAPIAPEGHEHGHSACSPSCPEGAWQSEQEGARVSAVVPFDNKETLKTHARCKPIEKPQAQFFNSAHKESNAITQFLTLYKREDLENDTFRYVEPVKSGRLGLLKILSIRIGATFNYTCPLQFSAFSNYLQNLGHFANGLNPYRLFYTPQKLKVSVARAPFLLRLPLHISPHSARPFALAPKEHGVQEKLDVWGTRTYTCKRHGKIDELPLQPLKLYNNSLRCFKNNKPLYVSSIKDGNEDLCGAPTLKGLKKKDGVNAYLHPELIKDNRFFLQTIAEYGDIVEEGYKNKILKSP